MDPEYRALFNRRYSGEIYRSYRAGMAARLGETIDFRLAETPVFLPEALRRRLESAASGILELLMEPGRLERLKRAIPSEWNVPGMDRCPSFVQIDLAVVREADGSLGPRLVELQGFPSLTAFQIVQRDAWVETLASVPGLKREWSCWFSGLDRDRFLDLARRTIVGSHDPREVILMDLDPPSQKTNADFAATRQLFGVEAVCPTALVRRGNRLWRRGPGGAMVPVKRIYNRVVFDELIRKGTEMPFDHREQLDVEWSPHPNWYWVWSKYALPFLEHPAVPRARLVSQLAAIPDNPSERYVLKPLFSFAGGGVNITPSREDLEQIPEQDRGSWCLQEKIGYEPALKTPEGEGVKVEVRMMFLRPDDAPVPVLAQNLCRLSRGTMHGVDFNRNFTWVGSSVALWPI